MQAQARTSAESATKICIEESGKNKAADAWRRRLFIH
jgi:hypothetical protein